MTAQHSRGRQPCAGLAAMVLAIALWPGGGQILVSQASRPQVPPRDPRPVDADAGAAGSAVIRGRVVSADTGVPLAGARVVFGLNVSSPTLRGLPSNLPELTTGADGRFELGGLAPGSYQVTVGRSGYVTRDAAIGPPLDPVQAGNDRPVDMTIPLTRGAVIAGRVADDRDNDIAGARVAVMRWRWERGRRLLANASLLADETDDRGQFRLFGIPAGTYNVVAFLPNLTGADGLTAFYPGTTSASEALALNIRAGDELSGITIALPRATTASISGVVTRMDGRPFAANEMVTLRPAEPGTSTSSSAFIGPDGSYVFSHIRAGDYLLEAVSQRDGDSGLRAREQIRLDGADLVVPLTLRTGNAVRGRYVFEGGVVPTGLQPPRATTASYVGLTETDSSWMPIGMTVRPDWTFELTGLNGRYRLRPPVPGGYGIKSIAIRGADITDALIDVVDQDVGDVEVLLTSRITRLTGSVAGITGVRSTAAVVVFPDDPSKVWPGTHYVRAARLNDRDAFVFNGLAPARYLAIAVAALEPGEETNPELLQRFRSRATPFTLAEGEERVLDLSVSVP